MSLAQPTVKKLSLAGWAPTSLREIYIALACVGALSSALAVAQWGLGWFPFPVWSHGPAMAGLLYNPIHQGQTLALMIVVLAVHRLWWFIPPLLPGLLLSHSRGAWLALAFGLIATRFRYPLVFLILALAVGVLYTSQINPSDSQRLAIWHAAWINLTFWGNGFGSFNALYMGSFEHLIHPEYAHNDYLQTVFEFGVWSVVPFGVVAWAASRTTTRDWPTLVTFLFVACFSMPLHMPIMAGLFALALIGAIHA